jgi:microcystin-dependent protein
MSDQFLGEVRIFAGNFAPAGWALCNGQLLPISQNTALFSLLGTNFGGDGRTTFGLPNLQAAAPLAAGQGIGLTPRSTGETGGVPVVALSASQLPAHTHAAMGTASPGTSPDPANAVWGIAAVARGTTMYASAAGAMSQMHAQALSPSGGGQPHINLPPYLGLTFIIALQGIFPARS